MQRLLLICLAWMLAAGAQQVGQNTQSSANKTATFQATSQLVIETVTVKDKSGKSVEGLTDKDFTVTEDGAPQTIRFFEFQKLQEDQNDSPAPAPAPALATGKP